MAQTTYGSAKIYVVAYSLMITPWDAKKRNMLEV